MLFNQEICTWNDIVNQNYDLEFDYIAIDKTGQIAFFSTFNRGYIPKCVTSSFEKFLELNHYLEKLPKTSESIFKKEDENESGFQDWKNYAALGFFAYDNQDAHRIEKLYQYDIIYKLVFPIKIESTILNSFQEIIPAFDLIFGEDVKFEILEKSLKTKPDRF